MFIEITFAQLSVWGAELFAGGIITGIAMNIGNQIGNAIVETACNGQLQTATCQASKQVLTIMFDSWW